MQKNRTLSCPSPTKTDHLTWSPGAIKAAHCSWGSGGRTAQDGLKAEDKFHWRPLRHACVCVSCVATQNARVLLCVVLCDHNKLTYWPYLLLFHVYPQALQEEALEDGQVSDPVRDRVIQVHGLGPRTHSAAVLHDWPTLEKGRRGEERRGEERRGEER